MKAHEIKEPGFYWTRTRDGEHRVVEIRRNPSGEVVISYIGVAVVVHDMEQELEGPILTPDRHAALLAEIGQLKDALRFYADRSLYYGRPLKILKDGGLRARTALGLEF